MRDFWTIKIHFLIVFFYRWKMFRHKSSYRYRKRNVHILFCPVLELYSPPLRLLLHFSIYIRIRIYIYIVYFLLFFYDLRNIKWDEGGGLMKVPFIVGKYSEFFDRMQRIIPSPILFDPFVKNEYRNSYCCILFLFTFFFSNFQKYQIQFYNL